MVHLSTSQSIQANLAQRLQTAASVLLPSPSPRTEDPAHDAAILLDLLVSAVKSTLRFDHLWLLATAVVGAFPTVDDVIAGMRHFELTSSTEATFWLMDLALERAQQAADTEMVIIPDRVIVDVDHAARYDLHTGIQHVVRQLLPLWEQDHDVLVAAWTEGHGALRSLSEWERHRVVRWGLEPPGRDDPSASTLIIVPWHTVVTLVETPSTKACDRLAALARFSGNRVVAIGYDCVPVVSGDLVPPAEPSRFARYLSALKYAHRVAGISATAVAEFTGFASALAAQGLEGPTVVECSLPDQSVNSDQTSESADLGYRSVSAPLVLCVGSLEPRKNHLALLFAAEQLWREGVRFELLLIAGSAWSEEVMDRVAQLRDRGRPISTRIAVSNSELRSAYRQARFSVLVSLHEGFGLPVAESLAMGTPVITTNYGSTKEIAAGGGALLVDPRNDDEILAAIRVLVRDDEAIETLRREISARAPRSWSQYATELWDRLVQPVRSELVGIAQP